jgi:hypothetical protein
VKTGVVSKSGFGVKTGVIPYVCKCRCCIMALPRNSCQNGWEMHKRGCALPSVAPDDS